MDFGFVFMGDCHIHPEVKYAEDNGFSHAWLYDTQMLGSEVYAALALCADRTHTIKLGPGVTNPASRIAPLSACGMATINSIKQLDIGKQEIYNGTINVESDILFQLILFYQNILKETKKLQ